MTNERASANDETRLPALSVYEQVLRIENFVLSADILADQSPALAREGAPPIHFLLEHALEELERLAKRVSD